MKKIKVLMTISLCMLTVWAFGQTGNESNKITWSEIWKYLALGIPALYEFLSRIIPTVKDYTIIGKVLKFLKWLSDKLQWTTLK